MRYEVYWLDYEGGNGEGAVENGDGSGADGDDIANDGGKDDGDDGGDSDGRALIVELIITEIHCCRKM